MTCGVFGTRERKVVKSLRERVSAAVFWLPGICNAE